MRPNETGLLAEPADPKSLSEKIHWMIQHPEERMRMGENGRRISEREFSLELQARNYITLYQDLVS
ncbi:MAG: hypothetical protein C5B54_10315 [Acidobacteria bacterium]|nr:MAG: hypothetical protein C5B54_10315 [Acidobacteriota bacterium]